MGRWERTRLALAEGAASEAGKEAGVSFGSGLESGIRQGAREERSRVERILGLNPGTIALIESGQVEVNIEVTHRPDEETGVNRG